MTYMDDLEKMKNEASQEETEPDASMPSGIPRSESVSQDRFAKMGDRFVKEPTFTTQEQDMPYFKRVLLPFIQHSAIAALIFVLVALLWVAISDTVFASIYEVPRSTILKLMIKDSIYVVVSAMVMYQILRSQFSHYYHLEQDFVASQKNAKKWESIQSSMMETIPDTLAYTLDCDLRYTSFNTRHKYSMLRMWHQEIRLGECFLDYIPDEALKEKTRGLLERALNGEYISDMEKFGDNDLTASYWKTYFAPILDEDKKVIGVSCFITNITSLKQSQNKNLFLSYHDPLTKLYNRVYCLDLMKKAEQEEIAPYSIISIEIQGMRQVNDTYGTETGDKLLVKVSEILTRCVKDNGSVVKWASDEFIVLLPEIDSTTAEALTNIARCEFSGVTVNGVPIRAYFGFATRTSTEQSMKELLQAAELCSTNEQVQVL